MFRVEVITRPGFTGAGLSYKASAELRPESSANRSDSGWTGDLLKSFGCGMRNSIGLLERRWCHLLAAHPIPSKSAEAILAKLDCCPVPSV
jgi:hypothetical protein